MCPTCDLLRFLCSWELTLHHSWEILRNNIFQSCFFPMYFFFLLEYMLEQFLALSKMTFWLNSSFAFHALFDTFLLIFTWVHWCCSVLRVAVCCIGCFLYWSHYVLLFQNEYLFLCNSHTSLKYFISHCLELCFPFWHKLHLFELLLFFYWCSWSSSEAFLTRALVTGHCGHPAWLKTSRWLES